MIREARAADAEALAALSDQLGYPAAAGEVRERLAALALRGDGRVLVAEAKGRVIGWVHVFGAHLLETAPFAEIGGLVVGEGHRGGGVGGRLLAAAEEWAAGAGYAVVRVRSNVVRERAHRFYERLGYRSTKRQAVFAKAVRPAGAGAGALGEGQPREGREGREGRDG
jgi:GNAT superfamily N-acetyltransferase